jgi:hypothetical protein
MKAEKISFPAITVKTIAVHTITYSLVGWLAYTLFDYSAKFAEPVYSAFMRQTDSPLVIAGVLFQPIRGVLFGVVFYLLQDVLFRKKYGWLVAWCTLVLVGIFSTFGPSPGSIEGFIYTVLPLKGQLGGLSEVILQSLLLSWILFFWVNHPEKRWLNWTIGVLFLIAILLPVIGLLVSRG